MKPINFEKYKFKLRSLPNYRTIPRYWRYYVLLFLAYVIYNFVTICLFSRDFTPSLPAVFVLAIPIMFIHIYYTIENEFLFVSKDTFKEIVVHIRLNQTQSLIERLEENPEIIKSRFDKKSLLYWARHYKNLEAHKIIIEQMKKAPR